MFDLEQRSKPILCAEVVMLVQCSCSSVTFMLAIGLAPGNAEEQNLERDFRRVLCFSRIVEDQGLPLYTAGILDRWRT